MTSDVHAALLAERDEAIRVLRAGVAAIDRIEPAAAREPIRWMLLAAVERCGRGHHVLGLSINHELALARALFDIEGPHG
jgi:hypothetical protein